MAANQFFVALLVHARHHPGTGLARWWSERTTAAAFGRRIHPDGHGVFFGGADRAAAVAAGGTDRHVLALDVVGVLPRPGASPVYDLLT